MNKETNEKYLLLKSIVFIIIFWLVIFTGFVTISNYVGRNLNGKTINLVCLSEERKCVNYASNVEGLTIDIEWR